MASRKRRKLETNVFEDVLADLDLEISVRERMVDTVESRIAWALILQESLEKGGSAEATFFRSSVFDTLSAVEEPLEILFSQQSPLPPQLNNLQGTKAIRFPPKQNNTNAKNSNIKFLYIRSAGLDPPYDTNHIQTYLLRCPTCLRQTFTSLQGLLNHARISHNLEWGTHDECVRACAVVEPNLDLEAGIEVRLGPSGILPGLRSLFQMAVGVHRPQELEDSMANGVTKDISPREFGTGSHLSRTLGLHQDTPALAPFLGKQAVRREISVWDVNNEIFDIVTTRKESDLSSAHPSKGMWRMPFKHRNSATCSADSTDVEPIILTVRDSRSKSPSPDNQPKRPFVPDAEPDTRNEAFSAIGIGPEGIELASGTGLPTFGSRFHFTARIVLTDRSLWVPPDGRQETNGHTHKWMLSVDSPSYSYNVTSILQHLRVTPLSDSSVYPEVLTKSEPPFAVFGTTDQPFLAKVELVFGGVSYSSNQADGQAIVLEHWVELDLLRSANGAIGDEQVIDIELDKRTILMPPRTTNVTDGSKGLWNLNFGRSASVGTTKQGHPTKEDNDQHGGGYEKILSSLVGKFPMTQKDVKNARLPNPTLPYKLVSTPAQLQCLVHGRRKAIEWGRARALQNAYTREVNSLKYAQDAVIPLTIGDVFAWLTEEGHFLEPLSSTTKGNEDAAQALKLGKRAGTWCSVCGQDAEAHGSVSTIKKETADPRPKDTLKTEYITRQPKNTKLKLGGMPKHTVPIPCNIVPFELQILKLHISNLGALTNPDQDSSQRHNINSQASDSITRLRSAKHYQPAVIVSIIPPVLTLAVRKLILPLNLPTFNSGSLDLFADDESSQGTSGILGSHRYLVERHLAPHAMVAFATKQFIRILIEGALEVSKREKAAAIGLVASTTRKKRKVGQEKSENIRLLTPAHILSSVMTRGQGQSGGYRELDVAIAGCLTKLGVLEERHSSPNGEGLNDQSEGLAKDTNDDDGCLVKTEQP